MLRFSTMTDGPITVILITQIAEWLKKGEPNMKSKRGLLVLAMIAGMLIVPGFSLEVEAASSASTVFDLGSGMAATIPDLSNYGLPSGIPLQLWPIIGGREGFSIYDADTIRSMSYGMPLSLWRMVTTREGFSIYDAATLRTKSLGSSFARPIGMPVGLWRVISGRDGFNIYEDALEFGSSGESPAKPGGMPADLWEIINGRDGFGISSTSSEIVEIASYSGDR
jgi:hypothetical protein